MRDRDQDHDRNHDDRDDEDRDDWERVGETLDWVAAAIADRLDRDPLDLVRPAIAVGLAAGLSAEALNWATGGNRAQVLLGIALTLFGYGMLVLLAERFRRSSGSADGTAGTTGRSAEAALLAPWLRRLQVLMLAVLGIVVCLALYGSVTGSWLLVARNVLEFGRVGIIVLALSWLLLDGDVGIPDWLADRLPQRPATDH